MAHLAPFVAMLHQAEQTLADSFRVVCEAHPDEAELLEVGRILAGLSEKHVQALTRIAQRYGEQSDRQQANEPARLHAEGMAEGRAGGLGLLRDLQDLHLLATLVQTTWTLLDQAAKGARDHDLMDAAESARSETEQQLAWLTTTLKTAAPQTLLAAR